MKKLKIGLSLVLCLFLLQVPVMGYTATYTITEPEMQQLENNFDKLKQINETLQLNSTESVKLLLKVKQELKVSQEELQVLRQELARLQTDLTKAELSSKNQEQLLKVVNQSFDQYAKEQKQKQAQLKSEKLLWMIATGVMTYVAIRK